MSFLVQGYIVGVVNAEGWLIRIKVRIHFKSAERMADFLTHNYTHAAELDSHDSISGMVYVVTIREDIKSVVRETDYISLWQDYDDPENGVNIVHVCNIDVTYNDKIELGSYC